MAIPTSTREQVEAMREQPMTDTPLTERLAQASETLAAHQEWDDADAVREAIRFFSESVDSLATARSDMAAVAAMFIDNDRRGVEKWARGISLDWTGGALRQRIEEAAELLGRVEDAEKRARESTDYAEECRRALEGLAVEAISVVGIVGCKLCKAEEGSRGLVHAPTCLLADRRTEIGQRSDPARDAAVHMMESVMGVDKGSPDGDCTVKGYRDAEGRVHVTSVERSHAVGTKQPTLDEFDKGPWTAGKAGAYVESEDFEHDARLNISGDFESHDARYAYACALAATLNRRTSQGNPQAAACDGGPGSALNQMRHEERKRNGD